MAGFLVGIDFDLSRPRHVTHPTLTQRFCRAFFSSLSGSLLRTCARRVMDACGSIPRCDSSSRALAAILASLVAVDPVALLPLTLGLFLHQVIAPLSHLSASSASVLSAKWSVTFFTHIWCVQ